MRACLRLAAALPLLLASAMPRAQVEAASSPLGIAAPPPASAASRVPSAADARGACEASVGDSIRQVRGASIKDLQFSTTGRTQDDRGGQVSVAGPGRYRRGNAAAVDFRYTCVFDLATGETSGVLFHETSSLRATALPVWQADLSRISPDACESAAASALQSSHPRASSITFDGSHRRLEPAAEGGTALSGIGSIVRAPGMPPAAFDYRCVFDVNGRLSSTHAGD